MRVEGDGYGDLQKAIDRGSYETRLVVPGTKAELKQVYQQEYGKSWQKHLSEDWARMQYGDTLSQKEFDKKAHNAARNFNPDRIESRVGGKNASLLHSLARRHAHEEKVPKDITGKRARINAVVWVKVSDDPKRKKTIDASNTRLLTKEETNEMKKAPTEETGPFDPIMDAYGINPGDIESIEVASISVAFV